VKNGVSIGTDFVRGFPLSQVKSAKVKGSAFFGLSAACVAAVAAGPDALASDAEAVSLPAAVGAKTAGVEFVIEDRAPIGVALLGPGAAAGADALTEDGAVVVADE